MKKVVLLSFVIALFGAITFIVSPEQKVSANLATYDTVGFKYEIGETVTYNGEKLFVWAHRLQLQQPEGRIIAWYFLGDSDGNECHWYEAASVENNIRGDGDCPNPPGPPC